MNNSRPIIKIFLFPNTERTERIFLFLPAHENARYAKMVFRLRIGKLRIFYKYINRLLLGSKKKKKKTKKKKNNYKKKKNYKKKTLKKTEKINE